MVRVHNEPDEPDSLAAHRRRPHPQPSSFGFTHDDSPPGFSLSSEPPGPGSRKRQFSAPSPPHYYADDAGGPSPWPMAGPGPRIVKLYVAGIPKDTTEEDIRVPFEEHGNVVEVVFIKSKKNGEQLDCCFVKYATLEEADRAIGALNDRYTFPGSLYPVKVRYADKEKERLGTFGQHFFKLYVGGLNKQATQREIAEIFSPFGVVEEVFIIRSETRQHRGCAFVQFSRRDMALAAINSLHGSYIMRKPKGGGSRPASNSSDQFPVVPNDSYLSPNKRCKPPLACSNSSECGLHSSNSLPSVVFSNAAETRDSWDCDWSEHICPDGYPYYYNCVTCESMWEKPEEYALFESQLLKLEQQRQQISRPEVLSTTEVSPQ
ncbi:OLC1v1003659C2 [Oldenlandia corymbosa var. corymbosa]|uniref:OLC1v1003659C2 n=1 Tax=Oldenlandia corymbosa var. corymbosa TaxID=529605 RepID=A0AAV1DAI0_OLDCO|nr:OLC1v1003659C2 [Oldenlandia corymbosa var. corymbosa]